MNKENNSLLCRIELLKNVVNREWHPNRMNEFVDENYDDRPKNNELNQTAFYNDFFGATSIDSCCENNV